MHADKLPEELRETLADLHYLRNYADLMATAIKTGTPVQVGCIIRSKDLADQIAARNVRGADRPPYWKDVPPTAAGEGR